LVSVSSTKAKRAILTPTPRRGGPSWGSRALWLIRFTIRRRYAARNRYEFSTPIEANSIDELAGKIGIDPTILNHTVREFNNAVRKDVAFDPKILDGKCTEGSRQRNPIGLVE